MFPGRNTQKASARYNDEIHHDSDLYSELHHSGEIINILWTGGWDSTYRILELVLIEHQTVRPYYVIDPKRKSIALEIIAMTLIRNAIKKTSPIHAAHLLPLEIIHREVIPVDEEISGWFQQLSSKTHIGSQYEWLARFAKHNTNELELCVDYTWDTPENDELYDFYIYPILQGKGHDCRIEGPFPEPAIQLFAYFRFPTIYRTKADMRIIAEKQGFVDIMKLTWFCHKPRNGLPCGQCRPCKLAPASGLEYTFYQPTIFDTIFQWIQKRRAWMSRKLRNHRRGHLDIPTQKAGK